MAFISIIMATGDINKVNAARTREQRVEGARKAGQASGVARRKKRDFREAFGIEPMTKDKVKEMDTLLLAMNEQQLREVADDKSLPVYMRRRARRMIAKDDFSAVMMSEAMMDRAFGKPKQEVEADVTNRGGIAVQVIEDGLGE